MKLVRSIHDNHRDLPAEMFWTREEFERLQRGEIKDWRLLSTRAVVKFVDGVQTAEKFHEVLEDEWPKGELQFEGKLKNVAKILVIVSGLSHEDLENEFKEFWNRIPKERKVFSCVVVDRSDWNPINPFKDLKIRWRDIFKTKGIRNYRRQVRRLEPEFVLLRQLQEKFQPVSEEAFERANIKPKELERWKLKLQKVDLINPNDTVIGLGRLRLRRNHWTINSNFNRSGKFFFTKDKIVLVRRKFMLFGFSLATLRPLEAFVRPANKILVFIRMIYHYLSEPLKGIARARPAFGPALAGIAVYFTLLADQLGKLFSPIIDWVKVRIGFQIGIPIPDIEFAINFALEYPEVVTGFAGLFAFVRWGFLKAFFRGEELVVLPFDEVHYILMDRNMVFGRWKVKGCNIVGAPEGIEYKIVFRDQEMAVKFFVSNLRKPQIISEEEKEQINDTIEDLPERVSKDVSMTT